MNGCGAVGVCPKCMFSFTYSRAAQGPILVSLVGQFWPLGLMIDSPCLKHNFLYF